MATGSPCSASMESATVSMATTAVAARMLENCCMVSGHSTLWTWIRFQQRGEIYSTICKGLKLHQQIRIINNFTQVKQTSQSFILQNNPLGFSNRRRLDRATDKFVHHGNVMLCLSQCHNVKMSRYVYHKTDSSIPIEWMSSWSEHADSLIFSVEESNMNWLCILLRIRIWRSSSLQNYFQPRMFSIALWQSFNGRCNIQNFQLFTGTASASGMDFQIPPTFWWSTDTFLADPSHFLCQVFKVW